MHEFEVLKELGKGSFGRVVKVRSLRDNQIYALKMIKMQNLSKKQKQYALNQVRLLASINSPHIISYKGAFFQQSQNILSILMEYADGGDLQGLLKKKVQKREKIEQKFILKIAVDILKGIHFLHSHNIIHRDIKSGNIFFVNGVAKIGDLNLSKVLKSQYAVTNAGTPYYTSPQIWRGQKYTQKCDIWSLGCLLYQMCCSRTPFQGRNFPEVKKKVTSGFYEPIPSRYSKQLFVLIRRSLLMDQNKRSSASELLQLTGLITQNFDKQGQLLLIDTIRSPQGLREINNQLYNLSNQNSQRSSQENSFKRNKLPLKSQYSGRYQQNSERTRSTHKNNTYSEQRNLTPNPKKIRIKKIVTLPQEDKQYPPKPSFDFLKVFQN